MYTQVALFVVGGVDKRMEVSTVSRRTLKTDDEEGFLRAYRDEILDTQAMYGVSIGVDIRVREGVQGITIHLRAEGVEGRPLYGHTVHARYQYPTSTATRLHAGLYQAAIRLNVAVQNEHRDLTGSFMSERLD